jgi:type II secretory pathway component PulF
MSSYLKANKTVREKILNAMLYPAIVLLVSIAGCFGIVFYILPKMELIFLAFNSSANNIEVEIENIYYSLHLFIIIFLIFAAGITVIFWLYKKNENFAFLFDRFLFKIPVIGNFISFLQTLNFSFAMEMLTAGGFTVSKALGESAIAVTNRAFRKSIAEINSKLLYGGSLSKAFFSCKNIPAYVGTWIAVGEKTGKVNEVFVQIRAYFQDAINNSTQKMMNMIEPVLILFVGIVIFILVIQFVLPVFALYGKVL